MGFHSPLIRPYLLGGGSFGGGTLGSHEQICAFVKIGNHFPKDRVDSKHIVKSPPSWRCEKVGHFALSSWWFQIFNPLILVKLHHLPKDRGEIKKSLKPPVTHLIPPKKAPPQGTNFTNISGIFIG